jgi:hypothetical protein
MKDWIDAAVEIGGDVLFWDEPHFYIESWLGGRPGTWGCYCAKCKEKYANTYGGDMPRGKKEDIEEFKEASLKDFLEEMVIYTHTLAKQNCLCVLPRHEGLPVKEIWEAFASISGLNIFGTDPYWCAFNLDAKEYVSQYAEMIVDICKGHKKISPQLWIQGFKIPAGREDEIKIAFDSAIKAGVRNIAVWSFEACACMSSIRAERPEVAWKVITDCFQEYRDLK